MGEEHENYDNSNFMDDVENPDLHDMDILVENRRRKKKRMHLRRFSENWDYISSNTGTTISVRCK